MTNHSIVSLAVTAICATLVLGCSCKAENPVPGATTNVTGKNAQLVATTDPPTGWQEHTVVRTNGKDKALRLPAKFQLMSAPWNHENAQMPEIAYMPEKKRLLMTIQYGSPVQTIVLTSDDYGNTWTDKRWLHVDAQGKPDFSCPVGMTYLGNGRLVMSQCGNSGLRRFSSDYGQTWEESVKHPSGANGMELYHWDPMLIDRDKSGKIVRLTEVKHTVKTNPPGSDECYESQAYIWFSTDGAKTWSPEKKIDEWFHVNEVTLVRARNNEIVASCRIDIPPRFKKEWLDNYCGMGVSFSKDNGIAWSKPDKLYDWGRHHASFVVMPNGDIVMAYVVRRGYVDSKDGFWQFGVEAVVSKDNGKTWDLDNKYILGWWTGKWKGENSWFGLSQTTSTVLLPDGSLLTTFGTGYRNEPTQAACKLDVGLVKWKLSDKPANPDRTIRDAKFDSDTRNLFDPAAVK